ncbi:hypothetical protein [Enterococcus wangshanyuanii]|uniref:Uncharacterized protein n=1 Tax=Enterococcus wangshanyuanii TaxID=2005703 RepID=A0ABQ1PX88_9ENTE|nr:hypothetical protein [Enterococcus wangshanyuanii]GGD06004.1 hypothetical protein GCM10011573_39260 [Enterococcus wangshanyuanii]
MKHKFFKALDETPFVLFLAIMSSLWVVAGMMIIILCIFNSTLKLKDIPMALFVVATSHMSIWIGLAVIVAYVIVRTLDFHSYVYGRKRLN